MRCHILASGRHTRYWRYIIDIAGLLTKGYLRVVSGMTRIGTMAPRRRALDKGARLQGALTIPPCGGSNRPTNRQRLCPASQNRLWARLCMNPDTSGG